MAVLDDVRDGRARKESILEVSSPLDVMVTRRIASGSQQPSSFLPFLLLQHILFLLLALPTSLQLHI